MVICCVLPDLVNMALFDLQAFVASPSMEVFEKCQKDDLLEIAAHFDVPVSRSLVKKEI